MVTRVSQQIYEQNNGIINYRYWGNVYYWVTVYGAVGNGEKDDTAAIQKAIDAAFAAGGGTVLIPVGTFVFTNLQPKSNVKIEGVNRSKSILKQMNGTNNGVSDPIHCFTSFGQTNIAFENLTIDGNKSGQTIPSGIFPFGVYTYGATDLYFDRVNIVNVKSHGLAVDQTINLEINKCLVKNCGNGYVISNTTNILISDSKAFDNDGDGFGFNGAANTTNNVIIHGSKAIGNGLSGFVMTRPSQSIQTVNTVKTATISNCIAKANLDNGFLIQATHASMTNCVSEGNGTTHLHQGFLVSSYKATITGNVSQGNRGVGYDLGDGVEIICSSNTANDNGGMGIEICSASKIVCCNNIVSNNNKFNEAKLAGVGTGISIYPGIPDYGDTVGDVICCNNIVTKVDALYQDYGILIGRALGEGTTRRIIVSNNNCYSSGAVADIRIFSNATIIQSGNIFNGDSFALESSNNLTVPDVGDTFYVYPSTGTLINNIFTQSGAYSDGRKITIHFLNSGITVKDVSGNLDLVGDFVVANRSSITLMWVGSAWCELSRSKPN